MGCKILPQGVGTCSTLAETVSQKKKKCSELWFVIHLLRFEKNMFVVFPVMLCICVGNFVGSTLKV